MIVSLVANSIREISLWILWKKIDNSLLQAQRRPLTPLEIEHHPNFEANQLVPPCILQPGELSQ
jgi:hypothetical protein